MDPELVRRWELAARSHNCRIAALALILWDYLLTFEAERELFWRKPFSVATFLFIWSRYIGLIVSIFGAIVATSSTVTSSLCWSWFRIEGWLGITSSLSVEFILQLRIYALYDRSRNIAILMAVAFVLHTVCLVAILLLGSLRIQIVAENFGNLTNCRALHVPRWLSLFWVVFLSFECLLCCLAGCKAYERLKTRSHVPFSSRSLQNILLRDSVLYYILIVIIYSINLVMWIKELPDTLDLLTGLAVAVPCVMGSRLMINVRSAHYRHGLQSPSDISLHLPEIIDTTPPESLELTDRTLVTP